MKSYQTAAIYLRYENNQIVDVEFFVSDDVIVYGTEVNSRFREQVGYPAGYGTNWRGYWLIERGRPVQDIMNVIADKFQESSSDGDE